MASQLKALLGRVCTGWSGGDASVLHSSLPKRSDRSEDSARKYGPLLLQFIQKSARLLGSSGARDMDGDAKRVLLECGFECCDALTGFQEHMRGSSLALERMRLSLVEHAYAASEFELASDEACATLYLIRSSRSKRPKSAKLSSSRFRLKVFTPLDNDSAFLSDVVHTLLSVHVRARHRLWSSSDERSMAELVELFDIVQEMFLPWTRHRHNMESAEPTPMWTNAHAIITLCIRALRSATECEDFDVSALTLQWYGQLIGALVESGRMTAELLHSHIGECLREKAVLDSDSRDDLRTFHEQCSEAWQSLLSDAKKDVGLEVFRWVLTLSKKCSEDTDHDQIRDFCSDMHSSLAELLERERDALPGNKKCQIAMTRAFVNFARGSSILHRSSGEPTARTLTATSKAVNVAHECLEESLELVQGSEEWISSDRKPVLCEMLAFISDVIWKIEDVVNNTENATKKRTSKRRAREDLSGALGDARETLRELLMSKVLATASKSTSRRATDSLENSENAENLPHLANQRAPRQFEKKPASSQHLKSSTKSPTSALSPRNRQSYASDVSSNASASASASSNGSRSRDATTAKQAVVASKDPTEEQKSQTKERVSAEIRRMCKLAMACFDSRSSSNADDAAASAAAASSKTKSVRAKRKITKKKRRTKREAADGGGGGGSTTAGAAESESVATSLKHVGEAFALAREHKIFTSCSVIGRTYYYIGCKLFNDRQYPNAECALIGTCEAYALLYANTSNEDSGSYQAFIVSAYGYVIDCQLKLERYADAIQSLSSALRFLTPKGVSSPHASALVERFSKLKATAHTDSTKDVKFAALLRDASLLDFVPEELRRSDTACATLLEKEYRLSNGHMGRKPPLYAYQEQILRNLLELLPEERAVERAGFLTELGKVARISWQTSKHMAEQKSDDQPPLVSSRRSPSPGSAIELFCEAIEMLDKASDTNQSVELFEKLAMAHTWHGATRGELRAMQRQRQLEAKPKANKDDEKKLEATGAEENDESVKEEAQLQALQLSELRKACVSWTELIRLLEKSDEALVSSVNANSCYAHMKMLADLLKTLDYVPDQIKVLELMLKFSSLIPALRDDAQAPSRTVVNLTALGVAYTSLGHVHQAAPYLEAARALVAGRGGVSPLVASHFRVMHGVCRHELGDSTGIRDVDEVRRSLEAKSGGARSRDEAELLARCRHYSAELRRNRLSNASHGQESTADDLERLSKSSMRIRFQLLEADYKRQQQKQADSLAEGAVDDLDALLANDCPNDLPRSDSTANVNALLCSKVKGIQFELSSHWSFMREIHESLRQCGDIHSSSGNMTKSSRYYLDGSECAVHLGVANSSSSFDLALAKLKAKEHRFPESLLHQHKLTHLTEEEKLFRLHVRTAKGDHLRREKKFAEANGEYTDTLEVLERLMSESEKRSPEVSSSKSMWAASSQRQNQSLPLLNMRVRVWRKLAFSTFCMGKTEVALRVCNEAFDALGRSFKISLVEAIKLHVCKAKVLLAFAEAEGELATLFSAPGPDTSSLDSSAKLRHSHEARALLERALGMLRECAQPLPHLLEDICLHLAIAWGREDEGRSSHYLNSSLGMYARNQLIEATERNVAAADTRKQQAVGSGLPPSLGDAVAKLTSQMDGLTINNAEASRPKSLLAAHLTTTPDTAPLQRTNSNSLSLASGSQNSSLAGVNSPTISDVTQFHEMVDRLPSDWSIVTLALTRADCSPDKRSLVISRLQADQHPVVVRLPLYDTSIELPVMTPIKEKPKRRAKRTTRAAGRRPQRKAAPRRSRRRCVVDSSSEDEDSTIDSDSDSNNTSTSRRRAAPPPLPIIRTIDHLSHVQTEFSKIMAASHATTLRAGELTSRQEKKEWWALREQLDSDLGDLLQFVEDSWFGFWKILLAGSLSDEALREHLTQLAEDLGERFFDFVIESLDDDQEDFDLESVFDMDLEILELVIQSAHELTDEQLGNAIEWLFGPKVMCDELFDTTKRAEMLEQCAESVRGAQERLLKKATQRKKESGSEGDETTPFDHDPVIMVLDTELKRLPIESMPFLFGRNQAVTRVPSIDFVFSRALSNASRDNSATSCTSDEQISVDVGSTFYVLNPSGDLKNTEKRFRPAFDKQWGWKGVTGAASRADFENALTKSEIFLYLGHMGGQQYMSPTQVMRLSGGVHSAALLLGCSSGALKYHGEFPPTGLAQAYMIANSPAVVSSLYDVTDKDLDTLSGCLLKTWFERSHQAGEKDEDEVTSKHRTRHRHVKDDQPPPPSNASASDVSEQGSESDMEMTCSEAEADSDSGSEHETRLSLASELDLAFEPDATFSTAVRSAAPKRRRRAPENVLETSGSAPQDQSTSYPRSARSLASCLSHARTVCRMKYLTGAAQVCYGVPVHMKSHDRVFPEIIMSSRK